MDRIDIDTDGAQTVAVGDGGHGALARADLRGEVARALSAHARDLLHGRAVAAGRRRRLQRHVSSVQGRPRSGGHVQERCARRQRLPVPVAPWIAALDAQALRGDGGRVGSLRRRRARLASRSSRSGRRTCRRRGSTRRMRTWTSRRCPTSTRCRDCGSPVALPAGTISNGRRASSPRTVGSGQITVTMPPGAQPMTASLAAARAADAEPLASRMGTIRAAAARRAPAGCRRRDLPLRSRAGELDEGRFATRAHARHIRGHDARGATTRASGFT